MRRFLRRFLWRCKHPLEVYRDIKHFFSWIIKVCQYAVVLWDDYDFDHSYITKLLKYKISRHRQFLEKVKLRREWYSENIDTNIRDMKTCEKLLEKILISDFCSKEWKLHEKKWGSLNYKFIPIIGSENYELKMWRENANTPEEQELERKESHDLHLEEIKRRNDAYKEVFSIMESRIQDWWD